MGLDAAEQFPSLPNFAQALVAVRMVHRAVLAKYPANDEERDLIESSLGAAQECCRDGDGTHRHKAVFGKAVALRDRADGHRTKREYVRAGVYFAIDSVNAAQGALDFPVDAVVTASAQRAIAALAQDRELGPTQISILLASDVDLLLFACGQSNKLPSANVASKYDGLGADVLGRLPPVHALSLSSSGRAGKDAGR